MKNQRGIMPGRLREIEAMLVGGEDEAVWAAAYELASGVETEPQTIWPLVVRFGSGTNAGVRAAIACHALEHILEHHFAAYFPECAELVRSGNGFFRETLRQCHKFGQAAEPENAKRLDDLCGWAQQAAE